MKPVFHYCFFCLGIAISIGWTSLLLAQDAPVHRPGKPDPAGQKKDIRNLKSPAGTWSCGQPFTDPRDGKGYNTIPIVNQCWMKENMNVGRMLSPDTLQSDNGILEKYCYNNSESNCSVFGGLYLYGEALQYNYTNGAQGICPSGWHVPEEYDWYQLNIYLNAGNELLGGMLKETGTAHWNDPNIGATNSTGFTALGSGVYYPFGWPEITYFYNINLETLLWVSKNSSGLARTLQNNTAYFGGQSTSMTVGYSVRCISNDPVRNQSLQNIDVYQTTRCYNATDTITVAGESTTFSVSANGSATLIAGASIIMLPETSVPATGYLHAYITTTGQFCRSLTKSLVAAGEEPEKMVISANENRALKVYPNPTTGLITLELTNKQENTAVVATLFDLFGKRIFQVSYSREKTHNISMENFQSGLYFLKVIDGDRVSTEKVLKR